MKKQFAFLLALVMILSLAACGQQNTPTEPSAVPTTVPATAPTTLPTTEPTEPVVEYPVTPETLGSGTVLWSEETTADGWIRVTNRNGETLGYHPDSGVKLIQVQGYAFKDLNKNGLLDEYEDWRLDDDTRAWNLVNQMDIDMVLPLIIHGDLRILESDGSEAYSRGSAQSWTELMDSGVRSALNALVGSVEPNIIAKWNNNAQAYAEGTIYGIPNNISSNPAYTYAENLALAATFDPELVSTVYATNAAQLQAVGVATLLGPQVDLSTEPRWCRITGTFGEDTVLVTDMANAAISALQSTYAADGTDLGWGNDSIIAMAKHFPGDGPGEGGRESHSASGKYTVYPGQSFNTSLSIFTNGALELESDTGYAGAVMASYSIAYSEDGAYGDLVGSAFSEWKLNLLRVGCDYDGVICCDWNASYIAGENKAARAWGMEGTTTEERICAMLMAGMDQVGGINTLPLDGIYTLLQNEMSEEAAEARIRESGYRILKSFLKVGLFENAYVTVADAKTVAAGDAAFKTEVQQKSVVMLKNSDNTIHAAGESEMLTVYIPMQFNPSKGAWSLPVSLDAAEALYNVVTDTVGEPTGDVDKNGNALYTANDVIRASADQLAECDMALIVVKSPINEGDESGGYGHDKNTDEYFPISLQYGDYIADSEYVRRESISGDLVTTTVDTTYGPIEAIEKENRSYYGSTSRITNTSDLEGILYAVKELPESAKIVVCVNATNPMVFSEFEADVDAILMGFGISNDIFLDIVSGKVEPTGLLPLQMPASMEAVEKQQEDVPRDMECYVDADGNTYDFAYGLNWSGVIQDARTEKYDVPVVVYPDGN